MSYVRIQLILCLKRHASRKNCKGVFVLRHRIKRLTFAQHSHRYCDHTPGTDGIVCRFFYRLDTSTYLNPSKRKGYYFLLTLIYVLATVSSVCHFRRVGPAHILYDCRLHHGRWSVHSKLALYADICVNVYCLSQVTSLFWLQVRGGMNPPHSH